MSARVPDDSSCKTCCCCCCLSGVLLSPRRRSPLRRFYELMMCPRRPRSNIYVRTAFLRSSSPRSIKRRATENGYTLPSPLFSLSPITSTYRQVNILAFEICNTHIKGVNRLYWKIALKHIHKWSSTRQQQQREKVRCRE